MSCLLGKGVFDEVYVINWGIRGGEAGGVVVQWGKMGGENKQSGFRDVYGYDLVREKKHRV
jgi:hypothetical protein